MIKKTRKHPDLSAVCFQVPSRNPNSRCSRFTPRRAAWLWSRANAPGASTGSRGIVFRATHVEPWTPPRDNTVSSSVWAREISSAGEYESNGYFSVCRVANPIQRGGRERGGGEGARFPPTWFLFPLGRGRARYPPEEKRSWGRGGWTHSRFDANRHNLSLSLSSPPLLFVLSENRRLHAPLRFPVIGFLELERRGKGTVTSRSYRVSSVSWSWGGRCFVRGERGERERNSRRPGQRFRSTVGLFTGLFSRSLCYFI